MSKGPNVEPMNWIAASYRDGFYRYHRRSRGGWKRQTKQRRQWAREK